MNYLEFFGLQSEPFLNSPSSRAFYKSAVHGKVLLKLMTAAEGQGTKIYMSGESGVGKSLLLRRALESVSDESTRAALVPVPPGGLSESALARVLGLQLKLEAPDDLTAVGAQIASAADEGQGVLVLVDDADRLDAAVAALLIGLERASVVFAGVDVQGDAGEHVEVTPLNAEACDAFIRVRLKAAGRVSEVFTAAARKKVHEIARGVPYRVNAVCEQALITGALAGAEKIDPDLVVASGLALGYCDEAGAALEPRAAASPAAVPGAAKVSEPVKPAPKAAAPAPAAESSGLDDVLGQLEDEETKSGLGDTDADEDGGLDSLLDDLSKDEDEAPVTPAPKAKPVAAKAPVPERDELDDLLGDLGDDEPAVPAAEGAADVGGELDDLLGGLDDEPEAPAPKKVAKAKPAEDDLDALLNDMADEEEPVQAPVADAGDELDDLLGGLTEDEPAAEPASAAADDELDDLLGGLADEEEPAPAPKAAAKPAAAKAPPPAEDDLDDLLSGLDDEPAAALSAAAGDDELDDLLGGLADDDEPAPAKAVKAAKAPAAADDDLDDLLGGLTDDEPEPKPVKPAAAKPAPAAKPAAKKPAPVATGAGDDLDDLLNSLDEPPAAPQGKDNLEDELDSLLDGLED